MDKIWEAGLKKQKLGIQTLPIDIGACVTNGDGVADHYEVELILHFLSSAKTVFFCSKN